MDPFISEDEIDYSFTNICLLKFYQLSFYHYSDASRISKRVEANPTGCVYLLFGIIFAGNYMKF